MTKVEPSISEVDLHAYIDGQLDPQRNIEITRFLDAHPDTAEKVFACAQINNGLHQLYDGVLSEPVPQRLLDAGNTGRSRRGLFQVAAMLAILSLGYMGGWFARDWIGPITQPKTVLTDNAFAAHAVYTPEVRHPVEVTSEEEKHLTGWLSKRLGTRIKAPQLSRLGYQLLGGRLLADEEGEPAAQFMYQDVQGNRLTLYLRRKDAAEHNTAFQYAQQDDIRGFYWIDGDLGYVLIGKVDRSVISEIAHLVYEELNQ